jgi:hypothetical protein
MSYKSKIKGVVELFKNHEVSSDVVERFDIISNRVGFKIPLDVIKTISLHAEFNDPDFYWLFDTEIFSLDDLESEYNSLDEDSRFLGYFGVDDALNIDTFHQVSRYEVDDVSSGKHQGEKITNLSRILPIGYSGGDYCVIDLERGDLASFNLSTFIIFSAPSVEKHLEDLIYGLEQGTYKFDDEGELIYPREWEKRATYKSING